MFNILLGIGFAITAIALLAITAVLLVYVITGWVQLIERKMQKNQQQTPDNFSFTKMCRESTAYMKSNSTHFMRH